MKQYNRIMPGRSACFSDECFEGGFIGADMDINEDLTGHLPEHWKDFNKEFVPKYLIIRPDKTKIAAGLACGYLYTVCKGLKIGDIVLSPDGTGHYMVGTITSDYYYVLIFYYG